MKNSSIALLFVALFVNSLVDWQQTTRQQSDNEMLLREIRQLEAANAEQHDIIWDNMEGLGRQQVGLREMVELPPRDLPVPVVSARYVSRDVEVATSKSFVRRTIELPGDVFSRSWEGVSSLWRKP